MPSQTIASSFIEDLERWVASLRWADPVKPTWFGANHQKTCGTQCWTRLNALVIPPDLGKRREAKRREAKRRRSRATPKLLPARERGLGVRALIQAGDLFVNAVFIALNQVNVLIAKLHIKIITRFQTHGFCIGSPNQNLTIFLNRHPKGCFTPTALGIFVI